MNNSRTCKTELDFLKTNVCIYKKSLRKKIKKYLKFK